jgi:hypothetical protein
MQSVTRAVLIDERNGGGKGGRDAYGKSEQKVRFRMLLLGLGILYVRFEEVEDMGNRRVWRVIVG